MNSSSLSQKQTWRWYRRRHTFIHSSPPMPSPPSSGTTGELTMAGRDSERNESLACLLDCLGANILIHEHTMTKSIKRVATAFCGFVRYLDKVKLRLS